MECPPHGSPLLGVEATYLKRRDVEGGAQIIDDLLFLNDRETTRVRELRNLLSNRMSCSELPIKLSAPHILLSPLEFRPYLWQLAHDSNQALGGEWGFSKWDERRSFVTVPEPAESRANIGKSLSQMLFRLSATLKTRESPFSRRGYIIGGNPKMGQFMRKSPEQRITSKKI